MLIRIYILILIAKVGILAANKPQKPPIRSYFVEKDFFNIFKLGDFSIYDSTKEHLLYRIKCSRVFKAKVELIDLSSQEVIGRLGNTLNLILYEGNFSIFDSSSNQWINGKMIRIFHLLHEKYLIKWNGHQILMKTKFGSLTTTFEYEYHSGILAKLKKRLISFIQSNKYDLQIFSNDLPNALYFLVLVVKEQRSKARYKA